MREAGRVPTLRCLLLLLLIVFSHSAFAAPVDASGAHGLVYVITDDGLAYGFRVLPGGALAALKTPPTQIKPVVRTPPKDDYNQDGWSSAADPAHSLVYATRYRSWGDEMHQYSHAYGGLQVYRIASDGQLTPVYKKPWSFPEALGDVTVDPKGRFVWISREEVLAEDSVSTDGRLFIFQHGQAGMLRKIGKTDCVGTFTSILTSGSTDNSELVISADGKFAYAYNNTGFVGWRRYLVAAYRVLPNGSLHKLGEDDSHGDCCEVMSFAINPANQFLYAADDDFATGEAISEQIGISVYALGGHRLKSPRLIVPYAHGLNEINPITIMADPTGRFLYASNNTGIQVYAINPDGTFAIRSRTPGLDLKGVSRDGHVLYALTTLGEKSAARTALVSARVNPDGTLTPLIPLLLPTGVSVRQVLVF